MVDSDRENQRDNDTDRYELNGSILASRRGGQTNCPGSKPIVQKRPTRLRSPNKAPVPDRPTLRPEPDRASTTQFHATSWRTIRASHARRPSSVRSPSGSSSPRASPCTNRVPDHATVARFVCRHQDALAGLFTEVLELCDRAGLVACGVLALDGTKLRGNATRETSVLRSLPNGAGAQATIDALARGS